MFLYVFVICQVEWRLAPAELPEDSCRAELNHFQITETNGTDSVVVVVVLLLLLLLVVLVLVVLVALLVVLVVLVALLVVLVAVLVLVLPGSRPRSRPRLFSLMLGTRLQFWQRLRKLGGTV